MDTVTTATTAFNLAPDALAAQMKKLGLPAERERELWNHLSLTALDALTAAELREFRSLDAAGRIEDSSNPKIQFITRIRRARWTRYATP